MLKDITLGQYFPGNSVIHRLDPRTKLIVLVVYMVTLFVASGWGILRRAAPVPADSNQNFRLQGKSIVRGLESRW